jgi:predicted  nucleic acid-binding Zn-ribbon protein
MADVTIKADGGQPEYLSQLQDLVGRITELEKENDELRGRLEAIRSDIKACRDKALVKEPTTTTAIGSDGDLVIK